MKKTRLSAGGSGRPVPVDRKQGLTMAYCAAAGNHLIGKLETTPASRSTLPVRYSPIRAASPAMTVTAGNSRRNTATRAGSRSNAMMRSGEHPARTRPCVRLPVPAPSSRTGPGRAKSMQRASASARRAPAWIGGGDSQRFLQPKGKEHTCIRVHRSPLLIGQQRDSISGVLQFFERYMLEHSRKTVINAWY